MAPAAEGMEFGMKRFLSLVALLVLIPAVAAQPAAIDSSEVLRRQFQDPPAGYRTTPFFVWNGEVSEADIDRYLTDCKQQGLGGFFIHPRVGLITPYLSEHWFDLFAYTVRKAKPLGLQVWLYDENPFPSGSAGGHVAAEMPESCNQGQNLVLRKTTALPPDAGSACRVLLRKIGEAFERVEVSSLPPQPGEYYCFQVPVPQGRGRTYPDLLLPGVTDKFLQITMPGYERSIGAEFGKSVPGIFSDEPNIASRGDEVVRWTPDLFAQFEKRRGYDIRPVLAGMFEDIGDWRKVRHDYYLTLLELFIERWSKPYYAYCEKAGLKWTGHYWEHGWPSPNHGPDNMAMYAWHQLPGIDLLFNQYDEELGDQFGDVRIVKEAASVAHQLGRRRILSETYGGSGWELRFEDLKRFGDWEYVLGVNFMNQHLAYQTIAGARKYDWPQSFSYHEPWWRHYRVLADYYARLSLALSSGEQINRILILEPTSTAWMFARPGKSNPRLDAVEQSFRPFLNRLEALQAETAKNLLTTNEFTLTGGKLYHQRRRLADGELLFFVNSSLDMSASAELRLAGRSLSCYDLLTGRIAPYPAKIDKGRLAFSVTLPPVGSLLLLTSLSEGLTAPEPAAAKTERRIEPSGPVMVKRSSSNVLRIDYCDLKLGGTIQADIWFNQAVQKVFEHFGFRGNPWSGIQFKAEFLDRDHFSPDSGFEAVFHFELAEGIPTGSLQAVVERPRLWHVSVNSTTIHPRPDEWWLDTSFGVYDIGAQVRPGANVITLEARPMSVHAEIQPVYILGDFGVAARDRGFRIVPLRETTLGVWKDQDLPFYSDAVSYRHTFELQRDESCKVRLGKWLGTVAEVQVNGKSAGLIGWPPYEADISSFVRNGSNRVEVRVYGSLKNLLCPHLTQYKSGLVGSWLWRTAPEHTPPGNQYDLIAYGLFEDFQLIRSARE